VNLTPRQLDYLTRLARGHHVKEIAHDLGILAHGVTDQLAIAKQRLGARSLVHAVVIALQSGLIKEPRHDGDEVPHDVSETRREQREARRPERERVLGVDRPHVRQALALRPREQAR
jgi:DNA-binding CsgD family transcriptional regulator